MIDKKYDLTFKDAQTWFQEQKLPTRVKNTKQFKRFYDSMTLTMSALDNVFFIMLCQYEDELKKYISNYKSSVLDCCG